MNKNDTWMTAHDDEGNLIFLNADTGEIDEGVIYHVRTGSKVFVKAPEQAAQEKNKIKKIRRFKGENFYFMNKDLDFEIIPSDLTKLVYINSFCRYTDNTLMKSERQPMTVDDLPQILSTNTETVRKFLNNVVPKYLTIDDDKVIHSNDNYFIKGRLKNNTWIKVYQSGIKSLYQSNAKTAQKQIGYIFMLLPYLNIEYNVLCHNPAETDFNNIQPMTITEFCHNIGYDTTQYKRLINAYGKIILNINGKKEKFCSFLIENTDLSKAKIIVNPEVLYSGNHKDELKIPGAFSVS